MVSSDNALPSLFMVGKRCLVMWQTQRQGRLSCQDQKVMPLMQGDGGMSSDTEYLQDRAKDLDMGPLGRKS